MVAGETNGGNGSGLIPGSNTEVGKPVEAPIPGRNKVSASSDAELDKSTLNPALERPVAPHLVKSGMATPKSYHSMDSAQM